MFHIHSIASRHHCRKQYNMHILFADFPIGKQNETMSSLNTIMHWCARSPISEIHPYFQAQLASNVYSRVRGNRAELNAHTNSCTVRLNSVETTKKKRTRAKPKSCLHIIHSSLRYCAVSDVRVWTNGLSEQKNKKSHAISTSNTFDKHTTRAHAATINSPLPCRLCNCRCGVKNTKKITSEKKSMFSSYFYVHFVVVVSLWFVVVVGFLLLCCGSVRPSVP